MIARLLRVLMLSAAVVAGTPLAATYGTQAIAAAKTAATKLSAAQMLERQGIAVTVIAKSYTALPQEARGKSTPFLKGLIDVANAYRDVAAASKARDNRKMGAALPRVATSLAKLNSAYQLSGIRDPKITNSLNSLNGLWKTYIKVVDVGAPHRSGKPAAMNTRKINHVRRELMRRGTSQKGDRRAAAQRAHLLALIKQADAASRQADQLWYASILMAEVYGYYAGTYEYYVAYEPAYAVEYRTTWQSISSETEYFYSESVSYYEEYSWSSYEETIEVSESYEFGLTEEEFTAAETEIETSGFSIGEEAESLYESSAERQALDSVETEVDVEEGEVTETSEPEATDDQSAGSDETPQAPDDAEEQKDGDGQGVDDALPDDDACAGENPPAECAATSTEDSGAEDEALPDQQSEDEAASDEAASEESSQEEALPDEQSEEESASDEATSDQPSEEEALPDEQSQEDASPDDDGMDDSTDQSGEEGDACAGDNPPAECFASDEGASADEGGNEESYEEPAQDDAAAEEDSGGGEDFSGDDSGGEDYSGGDDSGGDESYDEE